MQNNTEKRKYFSLRKLKTADAEGMLEWMHDPSVVEHLRTDFASKTMEDCLAFIAASEDESRNLNLALTDESNEYLGTVSLKNIHEGTAEFAVTIRKKAMGTSASAWAMQRILEIGLQEKELDFIYWCVDLSNKRAIRFYDKNGYQRTAMPEEASGGYSKEEQKTLIWYAVSRT